jgi:hypothetical protein
MAARKHCDRIISTCSSIWRRKSNSYEASALVELMQKDSSFPCFVALGAQTATQLRERFQPTLTHALVGEHCDRLIETSVGSNWTRLYDSVCLDLGIAPPSANFCVHSSNTILNRFCECHIVDFVEHSILVIEARPRQKVLLATQTTPRVGGLLWRVVPSQQVAWLSDTHKRCMVRIAVTCGLEGTQNRALVNAKQQICVYYSYDV